MTRTCKLPPLILHPFSDVQSPQKLVQSSRANLMLQGLLPNEEFTPDQLERIVLEGRFCELKMLFYVGRDVLRWIEQCLEVTTRDHEIGFRGYSMQSFAVYLIDETPENVRIKLNDWGVADYRAIFSRSIGINSVFAEAPDRTLLSNEFVRNYHYYTDQLYTCWLSGRSFEALPPREFDFDLYASGEYSRMLERQWQDEP